MILPIYASLEQIDHAADRGGQGPLRVGANRLPQGHPAAHRARDRRRHAAHLHPGGRRLHQRRVPRRHQHQAMIGNMIQSPVSGRSATTRRRRRSRSLMMAVILVDGADLHPLRRLRGADGRRGEARLMAAGLVAAQRAGRSSPALAVAYMLIPIVVIIVFSLQRPPAGKLNFTWQRVHARALEERLRDPGAQRRADDSARAGGVCDPDRDRARDDDRDGPGPLPVLRPHAPRTS